MSKVVEIMELDWGLIKTGAIIIGAIAIYIVYSAFIFTVDSIKKDVEEIKELLKNKDQ